MRALRPPKTAPLPRRQQATPSLPPTGSLRSPCLPLSPQVLQGSTAASKVPPLPPRQHDIYAVSPFPILRPILILFSSKGSVKVHEGTKGFQGSVAASLRRRPRSPHTRFIHFYLNSYKYYPGYNIVIYNLFAVPLQGSPNTLLFASTLNVLLPYDNVDTIDGVFVAWQPPIVKFPLLPVGVP